MTIYSTPNNFEFTDKIFLLIYLMGRSASPFFDEKVLSLVVNFQKYKYKKCHTFKQITLNIFHESKQNGVLTNMYFTSRKNYSIRDYKPEPLRLSSFSLLVPKSYRMLCSSSIGGKSNGFSSYGILEYDLDDLIYRLRASSQSPWQPNGQFGGLHQPRQYQYACFVQ